MPLPQVAEEGGKEGWILLRPSLHDPGGWAGLRGAGCGAPAVLVLQGRAARRGRSSIPLPCRRRQKCTCRPPTADIVLNVESEHEGGMRAILQHLLEFFREHPGVDKAGGWGATEHRRIARGAGHSARYLAMLGLDG